MKFKSLLFSVFAFLMIAQSANAKEAGEKLDAQQVFEELQAAPDLSIELVKTYTEDLGFIQKLKLSKLALADVRDAKEMGAANVSVGMYILAVVLPPLAVFLHTNEVNVTLLNLLLTLLGWLPGVVHALVFVLGV